MNIHATYTGGRKQLDTLFSSLAHHDRRLVLGTLYERASERLTPRDLAVRLCDKSPRHSTDSHKQVRISLVHSHLPKLEAANLVTWDSASNVVWSAEHEAIRNTELADIVTGQQPVALSSLDEFFNSLANSRRRIILDVLNDYDAPMQSGTLAHKVQIIEQAATEREETSDQIQLTLYHNHLPKLADSGLITYDSEKHLVEHDGHPLLESCRDVSSLVLSSSQA